MQQFDNFKDYEIDKSFLIILKNKFYHKIMKYFDNVGKNKGNWILNENIILTKTRGKA